MTMVTMATMHARATFPSTAPPRRAMTTTTRASASASASPSVVVVRAAADVRGRRPRAVLARRAAPALGVSSSASALVSASASASAARGAHARRGASVVAGASSAEDGGWNVHAALDAGFGSIALLGATALSLVLANSAGVSGPYLSFWHAHVGPASLALNMSIHHWINEGLMAVFFFAVGLEIKREFVHGALKSLQQAALPCIGALGGMIVPMAVYLGCNNPAWSAGAVAAGWAVPMATDIAFAMGVYNFFKNKMPAGVAAFLLTLATVDDLGAIAVIAVCFAKSLAMNYIAGAALTCAALFVACKKNVTNMAVYGALGVALWYCLLQGGVNADVAGVIAAFAVPANAPAPAGSTAEPEHAGGEPTLLDHLVHKFAPLSALFIMPMFALANTAVPLDASMVSGVFTEPVGRGIMLGLLLGKPVGIAGLSWIACKMNLGKLPTGMTTDHLLTVGVLGGIGFTMCLFLVECCFASNPAAANVGKLSVLLSSTLAATLGAAMMARMPDPKAKLA